MPREILDSIWITNSKQLQNLKFFHFGANRGLVALHGLYDIKSARVQNLPNCHVYASLSVSNLL